MEGILWKWTNYWNGWQTRWFVLENGVLTYYKSKEEVNQGCKGSMKVQACEINVSTIDMTRMDLVIPGEQHMYLRAATSQERQLWLVALGSAKACVHNRNRKDSETNPDALKTKKSELRLYCDLLMQQVHTVKTAINNENGPEINKMDDATNLLGATCDTFIKTLEECMKLANANILYELPQTYDVTLPPLPTNHNPPSKKYCEEFKSRNEYQQRIPPDIAEVARAATLNLLPEKSRDRYEKAYKQFMNWCDEKKTKNVARLNSNDSL